MLTTHSGYNDDDENRLIHHMVVKKDNLDECYRIVFRMARKRGDDFVWSFIIKVFLDFYAELNPKMEHFIFKLKEEWKENIEDEDLKKSDDGDNSDNDDVMLFAYIVKNMFIRKSISYNVYNARIGVLDYKYTITKNKSICYSKSDYTLKQLINKYGNKYSVLLNALHSKNIDKVAYKLFTHLKSGDDVDILHRIIIDYFSCIYFAFTCDVSMHDVSMQHVEENNMNKPNNRIFEKWKHVKENISSELYFNYLITIIIHLFADEKNINKSVLFVRPNLDNILV